MEVDDPRAGVYTRRPVDLLAQSRVGHGEKGGAFGRLMALFSIKEDGPDQLVDLLYDYEIHEC